MWDAKLGRIAIVKHVVNLEASTELHKHLVPSRAGPRVCIFERTEIENMLAIEGMDPAKTECASPVVFAPKKNGIVRFYVNYRKLNVISVSNSYSVPRMNEYID